MTFKPTHRSAVAGTPLMQVSHDDPMGCGVYENSEGHRMLLNDNQVEPIPQEEHVKLEPGKRYTMTLAVQINRNETVAALNPARFIRSISDLIEAGATFNLLPDPLPTTPDSVIMVTRDSLDTGNTRMRIVLKYEADDFWHGTSGQKWTTKGVQSEVGGHLNGEITVLFDAGAPRDPR